jgi:hypothetical protein
VSSESTPNDSQPLPSEETEIVAQPIGSPQASEVVPDLYGMTAEAPASTCNAMASAALIGSILGSAAVVVIFVMSLVMAKQSKLVSR